MKINEFISIFLEKSSEENKIDDPLCKPSIEKLADAYLSHKWNDMDKEIWHEEIAYEKKIFIDGANAVLASMYDVPKK